MDTIIHSIRRRDGKWESFEPASSFDCTGLWFSDAGRDRYTLSSGLGFVAEDEIEPVVGEDSRVTMLHLTTSSEPLSRPDCAMVRTDRQLLLPSASFLRDTFVLCA